MNDLPSPGPGGHPPWLEALDHTADAGFVVSAATLPELFSRAAWAMFALLSDVESVQPAEKESVELAVGRGDLAAGLVRWLSELNFRHITEGRLYSRFEVLEWSEDRLRADVYGERIDHSRHTVHTEIKAVTFHELLVEERQERWRARVIFDV